MTGKQPLTFEAPEIERPALRKHIPCMAQIIQHALGAFIISLSVINRTKTWETHEYHL